MKPKPGLSIFRNKKTGALVIVSFAPDKLYGGKRACGPLIYISMDQIYEQGPDIIINNLRGFEERDSNQENEMSTWSLTDQKKFDREHILVDVRQESSSRLILTPMHPSDRGGFVGHRGEEITVNLPISRDDFYQAIKIAVEKSGK